MGESLSLILGATDVQRAFIKSQKFYHASA